VLGTFKTVLVLLACVCATILVSSERLHACGLTLATAEGTQKSSTRSDDSADTAYVPRLGSPERKAIMDALRGDQKVIFKVLYLKVHGDWAWVDVTPLDDKGRPIAEGGPSLVHKEMGVWKVISRALNANITTVVLLAQEIHRSANRITFGVASERHCEYDMAAYRLGPRCCKRQRPAPVVALRRNRLITH
jgi:hypothetical protein